MPIFTGDSVLVCARALPVVQAIARAKYEIAIILDISASLPSYGFPNDRVRFTRGAVGSASVRCCFVVAFGAFVSYLHPRAGREVRSSESFRFRSLEGYRQICILWVACSGRCYPGRADPTHFRQLIALEHRRQTPRQPRPTPDPCGR